MFPWKKHPNLKINMRSREKEEIQKCFGEVEAGPLSRAYCVGVILTRQELKYWSSVCELMASLVESRAEHQTHLKMPELRVYLSVAPTNTNGIGGKVLALKKKPRVFKLVYIQTER